MQTSKDKRMLVRHVEIAPAYQKEIAATSQHYQVMMAELKAKSGLFTQDLEEIAGGVR